MKKISSVRPTLKRVSTNLRCIKVFLHPHTAIDALISSLLCDLRLQIRAPRPLASAISDKRKSCIDLEPSPARADCKCSPFQEPDIGQLWRLLLRALPVTVRRFH